MDAMGTNRVLCGNRQRVSVHEGSKNTPPAVLVTLSVKPSHFCGIV